jgi:opacity protein-like surface antigen
MFNGTQFYRNCVLNNLIHKYHTPRLIHCIPILAIILLMTNFDSMAYAWDSEAPLHCQVMGMHMTVEEEDAILDGDDYKFSILGAAAQRPAHKGPLEYGLEVGLLFSMDNDRRYTQVSSGSGGGTVYVRFENKMLLVDYFAGGYVAYSFSKYMRIYAGAGPLIVYGRREYEPDNDEYDSVDSGVESKLAVGLYGRTGVEFTITDNFMIGAGIRALTSGLEFKEPNSKTQYEGIQYVFNLSFKINPS